MTSPANSQTSREVLERLRKRDVARTAQEDYEAAPTVEWEGPDDNNGEWPYPTRYVRREVNGALAVAVRRRIGATDDAKVEITEEEISGGYSEYTQETDYNMTVSCAEYDKEFSHYSASDNFDALLKWLDEAAVSRG